MQKYIHKPQSHPVIPILKSGNPNSTGSHWFLAQVNQWPTPSLKTCNSDSMSCFWLWNGQPLKLTCAIFQWLINWSTGLNGLNSSTMRWTDFGRNNPALPHPPPSNPVALISSFQSKSTFKAEQEGRVGGAEAISYGAKLWVSYSS